jgi:hypothetical protein
MAGSDAIREPALLDAKGASDLLNVPASWVAAQAREPEALRDWWRERQRGPWRDSGPRA